jgi:hypothetical protein
MQLILRPFGGVMEFRRARAYRHPLGPGFDSLHLHHFILAKSHLAAARGRVTSDRASTYDQKFIHFYVESRGET